MLNQLKKAFGLDVQINQAAKPAGLPVYMTNNINLLYELLHSAKRTFRLVRANT